MPIPGRFIPLWLVSCFTVWALRGDARGAESLGDINVFPPALVLKAGGEPHRVLVSKLAGPFEENASSVRFTVSDPAIASVDSTGNVHGLKTGATTLVCESESSRVLVEVTVQTSAGARTISFRNDVLPVLSKAGCNAGSCHAKPQGQNGFKLSVFAFDPKSDYQSIVKASRGRRVFPAAPDSSLLLLKPTMQVDHGGGRRLERDSDFYRLLHDWIEQGVPYGSLDEPVLQRIEVYPEQRRYRKGARQPLLVRAVLSDGSVRDVTGLADFRSNDKEVAQVSSDGLMAVGQIDGEGVVIARFMGQVAVSRVTVPSERLLPDSLYASLPVRNEMDPLVYAQHKKLGILPSEPCSDSEFLRRASLDAIGTLPSPEQSRAFLADTDPGKRVRAIDALLAQPAYGDYWATKWGDLIRPNPSRVGVKSVYLLDLWIRESFRENKPYDRFVRELLTAQGSTHDYGPAVLFRDRREPADAGAFVSQIFLGVRMECAKCHHHPNEKWGQEDYYQLAAFFSQVKRKGQGISAPISGEPEYIWHAPGGQVKHPISGEVMRPKAPDGPFPEISDDQDPRAVLADWISDPSNPFFARAVVNRVWAEFMGRGLVDPVDDFRASNPPTNPALLDWLASDFVRHGYNLKHLMRTIMSSAVYQQSSIPNETNIADSRNFSRSLRRRLTAEVLLDAVCAVTGQPDAFQGMPPGSRAIQAWNHKLDSEFMDAFGRPDASAECPCERDAHTSVVQALHLMNSRGLQGKINHATGRARQLAQSERDPAAIVTELYLSAYARFPSDDELRVAISAYSGEGVTRQSATEDVMWALLNSAEFAFNH